MGTERHYPLLSFNDTDFIKYNRNIQFRKIPYFQNTA